MPSFSINQYRFHTCSQCSAVVAFKVVGDKENLPRLQQGTVGCGGWYNKASGLYSIDDPNDFDEVKTATSRAVANIGVPGTET